MKQIIIFGSGCTTCRKLTLLVENIVKDHNIAAEVQHSSDYAQMAKLNIMSAPTIMIDGEIKSSGTIPTREEILKWLR